jgi:hypothetical protein
MEQVNHLHRTVTCISRNSIWTNTHLIDVTSCFFIVETPLLAIPETFRPVVDIAISWLEQLVAESKPFRPSDSTDSALQLCCTGLYLW